MIKSIEKTSVHRISSGQVLVDLQTSVKELVENSFDAGATTIDVKFKDYGVTSFEVSDNGSGIASEDYDNVAMKHCTSKLSTFDDLSSVRTFGFRGEALFSLCALSERVTITTATARETPMATVLEFDKSGKVENRSGKAARQRGTTVCVEGLFMPLPVRRKELQRNSKREFGKALSLLTAYALVPCTKENKGVRLSVIHVLDKGRKSDQIRTDGKPSLKASILSLWGPKQVDSLTELNLDLVVIPEKIVLKRKLDSDANGSATNIKVRGLISKFSPGHGRGGPDRQFFFINGRPCNPSKIQKAFNEVYRTFNANQSPFVVADFIVPTTGYDVNVSPDKRTILLHSENALVDALKDALEATFAPSRSTFTVQLTQSKIGVDKSVSTGAAKSPGANNLQEMSNDQLKLDAGAPTSGNNVDDVEIMDVEILDTTSPTPTLVVPDSLLESKKSDARSLKEPNHDVPQDVAQHAPTPHVPRESSPSQSSSIETPIPAIQPRPRPPSPIPVVRRIPSPVPAMSTRSVQMVLDTTNASWAMRPSSEEPIRKRRKLEELKGTNARSALRSQLLSFVSSGTQPTKQDDIERDGDTETADAANDTGTDIEEDELLEELQEIMMDPEADHGEASTIKGPLRWSVTNNNKPNAAGIAQNDPLFLPELDTLETMQGPDRSDAEPEDLSNDPDDGENLLVGEHEDPDLDPGKIIPSESGVSSADISAPSTKGANVEIVRTTGSTVDVTIPFSLALADQAWEALSRKDTSSTPGFPSHCERDLRPVDSSASLLNTSDEGSAEQELARVIDKEDFAAMEIVGQFNLGFIVARRRLRGRKPIHDGGGEPDRSSSSVELDELDDLFIIDQHAADEKYNFETLQQTTKIDSQRLFKPRHLELTAADELSALENIDILKSNGFEIAVDETAEPSQGRIKLVAQPVSGSTDFDMKDLEELLHLMQDRPAGQKKMVRCSKARAMFAMRACRKSVMIGMALNGPQMTSIVRHMGTMDQPWNCPHGRPTMRHLTSLNEAFAGVNAPNGSTSRGINWDDL